MHVKCKCWEESVFHMEDIGKSKNKKIYFYPLGLWFHMLLFPLELDLTLKSSQVFNSLFRSYSVLFPSALTSFPSSFCPWHPFLFLPLSPNPLPRVNKQQQNYEWLAGRYGLQTSIFQIEMNETTIYKVRAFLSPRNLQGCDLLLHLNMGVSRNDSSSKVPFCQMLTRILVLQLSNFHFLIQPTWGG